MSVATFITLLLVPVIYAIFTLDLKLIQWETNESTKGVATDFTDQHGSDPCSSV